MKLPSLAFLFLVVSVSSCTDSDGTRRKAPLLANEKGTRGSVYERFEAALGTDGPNRVQVGSDDFLSGSGARDMVEAAGGGAFTINLVGVPIDQAANAVLGDALGMNYTIDPNVSGTVTLQTTRPLSSPELLETFTTILEMNGAALQKSGSVWAVVPSAGAARRVVRAGDASVRGARVVAIPLEYISAAEMVRLLEPISGSSVSLQPIANRNVLLISGTRDDINAAIEAVNLFDADIMKGKSIGLFKLRAAEPEALVVELNTIFESLDGGSLQNVVTFVPSQRLGAILVVTSRAAYLKTAERWIRDLDKAAGGTKRRPVVYNLQNRGAIDLAPILSEMLQTASAEESAQIQGAPRVVADDAKNALIVWGNDSEQDIFAKLIQALDSTPVQVLLEATIAEVTLNDELNFGLRWFFEKGNFGGKFSDASSGSTGANSPGLSFLFQGASSGATLNALNAITDVTVVSSPSLMVVDNEEARLQIGDEVPIATQQVHDTSNPNAPVVNTISFRDTGIILSVKPRVSSSGQVVLDIEQEVSSVSSTTTSGIDSPTISQRKIKTTIVVTDGQTIALGGLIKEASNTTTTGVPGVSKVPVVGALFRNRKNTVARTELLILITPRVIRNTQDSVAVTDELRRRLGTANGIVQTGIIADDVLHRIID